MANDNFSKRLKICLELRNRKPINLAYACDISRGLISQYLNGTRQPKQNQIIKMAEYLDVSPLYLMNLQDNITNYEIKPNNSLVMSDEQLQRDAIMNEINSLCSFASLETLKAIRVLVMTVCKGANNEK